MTTDDKPQQTAALRAPSWLNRGEKRAFYVLIERIEATGKPISTGLGDAAADYVSARSRIATLRRALNDEVAKASALIVEKARVLALNREINALTALSGRLAERLGLD